LREEAMTEGQPYSSDTREIASAALGLSRRITVWLPDGAWSSPCPVLYLNDGQNLFDSARAFAGVTWRVAETAAWLIERRLIPPLVIVGIDHGELRRAREYLPVEDERNPFARDPLAPEYAAFVTTELMPFVEREYRVARGASNTAFGGSSYGAVAALFTSMTYPGTFGRLLLESPSLYVGRGALLKRARRAKRWPQRVYLGVGTAETRRNDWNVETVENVRRLETILRGAGLGPRRLRVTVEEGATHSESAWAGRLGQALEFLFGQTFRSA
jgi:predicted alpha/beta superfamily hydrolase